MHGPLLLFAERLIGFRDTLEDIVIRFRDAEYPWSGSWDIPNHAGKQFSG
jgi:hypothetical protein